jgi:hypothetical protein
LLGALGLLLGQPKFIFQIVQHNQESSNFWWRREWNWDRTFSP